jgi:folylpolyglutamate synthase/dihydropteroate synthase
MMRDKPTDDILEEIHGFADGAVFTETSNERGMDAALLAEMWQGADAGNAAEAAIRRPREAYAHSVELLREGRYDALVVCGSLYLISDLMDGAARLP